MSKDDTAQGPGLVTPEKGRKLKIAAILRLFFGGRSLNRFEASLLPHFTLL